jgi:phosphoserine phosphatase RsbU/P
LFARGRCGSESKARNDRRFKRANTGEGNDIPPPGTERRERVKILIAEDERTSRLVLQKSLQKLGHEVNCAEDGNIAWTMFRQTYYPVLISDWLMPHMDGLSLCRTIRSVHQDHYTYIILLTSLEGKGNYLKGMQAGADDFITKPFDADHLNARLQVAERILQLRQRVQNLEGLLPICCYCKKIRDEQGQWHMLESYIEPRSGAQFSHGICPECYVRESQAHWRGRKKIT